MAQRNVTAVQLVSVRSSSKLDVDCVRLLSAVSLSELTVLAYPGTTEPYHTLPM